LKVLAFENQVHADALPDAGGGHRGRDVDATGDALAGVAYLVQSDHRRNMKLAYASNHPPRDGPG
jgi:hypothetical protein